MAYRDEVLSQDIICDITVSEADYIEELYPETTIFGWIHPYQNRTVVNKIMANKLTAYDWGEMRFGVKNIFYKNNELAGYAAVNEGFRWFGKIPYGVKVAVIGRGNTARGAMKALFENGADVSQYHLEEEEMLRSDIDKFEVIVNCVQWDFSREDHLISRSDLRRMQRNSMIIDVSFNNHGAIETAENRKVDDPIYTEEGVLHYVVDNTSTVYNKTFTSDCSNVIYDYLDQFIMGKPGEILENAKLSDKGNILDEELLKYQGRIL